MRANRKNSIRTWGARLWTAWDLPGRISRGRAGLARAWQAWRADPRGHLARPFRRLDGRCPVFAAGRARWCWWWEDCW